MVKPSINLGQWVSPPYTNGFIYIVNGFKRLGKNCLFVLAKKNVISRAKNVDSKHLLQVLSSLLFLSGITGLLHACLTLKMLSHTQFVRHYLKENYFFAVVIKIHFGCQFISTFSIWQWVAITRKPVKLLYAKSLEHWNGLAQRGAGMRLSN